MKIVYVELKNIMGIKGLEFQPGKITVIDGKNGMGKTSVLTALQQAIGGGHDATLLAKGSEKGEVVLVFDDGTRLEKRIKKGSSKVTLKDAQGKDIPRAASFLKEIVDDICVNPIKILTSTTKDRVKLLLDSVPMQVPFEKIEQVTGKDMDRTDTRHPMQVIDEIRKGYYEDRTDNNRYKKEKEGQLAQMRDTLPFKAGDVDIGAELKECEVAKAKLDANFEEVKTASQDFLQNSLKEAQEIKEKAIERANDAYNAASLKAHKESLDEIEEEANLVGPKVAGLTAKIATLTAQKEEAVRVAGSIKYVKDGDQEIRDLEDESETLTAVIEELDTIKAGLLKNLPIEGMEIKEGEIYLDGIPFDRVNKSKRVQFALSIAGMRQAELPIVCVDNLEALDEESFAIFQEQASKTGMQFFVTRVSDSPELNVSTE